MLSNIRLQNSFEFLNKRFELISNVISQTMSCEIESQLQWMTWQKLLIWVCAEARRAALHHDLWRFLKYHYKHSFATCARGAANSGGNVPDTLLLLASVKLDTDGSILFRGYGMLIWKEESSKSWSNMKEELESNLTERLGLLLVRGTVLCWLLVVERCEAAYTLEKYYHCLV